MGEHSQRQMLELNQMQMQICLTKGQKAAKRGTVKQLLVLLMEEKYTAPNPNEKN